MPKYNDFDLDLQKINSDDASMLMINKTLLDDCNIYSGRYTCDPVPRCINGESYGIPCL